MEEGLSPLLLRSHRDEICQGGGGLLRTWGTWSYSRSFRRARRCGRGIHLVSDKALGPVPLELEELIDQCSSALIDHVGLRITQADGFPVILEGLFQIEGPKGPVDAYNVRIEFPEEYPALPPVVFETQGRLPREIDRHVFSDGHACLEVWPVWRAQNGKATVRTVLNGPVRNFFLSQSVFESSGKWPFGEYAHGDAGKREALKDVLRASGTEDEDLLWRAYALVRPPLRQHTCPCGSGRLYRKCHRQEIQEIAAAINKTGLWEVTDMYLKVLQRS